jgi:xanthosine utilization system XapX-like protein
MLNLILIVVLICLVTVGLVFLIDRFLPQKVKPILVILFGILSIFLGFKIYDSINAPIEFNKVRNERFAKVINKLKDIRDSQEAYKTVNGKYANDFESLIKFIDTGNYTITTQRDSSFMRYDRVYQIEMQQDTVIIDTLGTVKVKDSLFGADDRYKTMMNVPYAQNDEKFEMKADIIDKSGYKAPVFEAKVKKNVVLYDQPEDLVEKENSYQSVEEVNGTEIKVGSLTDVSTNGNWPPVYDRKKNN